MVPLVAVALSTDTWHRWAWRRRLCAHRFGLPWWRASPALPWC